MHETDSRALGSATETDSPNVNSVLRTEGLNAGYGNMQILHDVEINVAPGAIVSAIGPNGAGKSTLLKAIYGLINVMSGRVILTINETERDITNLRPDQITQLGMNYVPQIDNTFPMMTVWENLLVGSVLAPRSRDRQADKVFDLFPALAKKRDQRAETLSGGQRQMVAFGRALMSDPWLIVLDEPSAGLAPNIVDEVFADIGKINESGIALLVVEQNARKILSMSHYAYVLEMGRNRFEGVGQQLLEDDNLAELYLGGSGTARPQWNRPQRLG